jgi:hypothetical protein
MKPRLKSAPLTTEDDWAWYMVMCRKNGRAFGIRSFSIECDRLDADVMLSAQSNRFVGQVYVGRAVIHWIGRLMC